MISTYSFGKPNCLVQQTYKKAGQHREMPTKQHFKHTLETVRIDPGERQQKQQFAQPNAHDSRNGGSHE